MLHERPLQQRQGQKRSLPARARLVAAAFSSLLFVDCATATEITWQANPDNNNNEDPAKTAPRSQKYWDDHNIQRPGYAKTDAELWAERRAGSDDGGGWWNHPAIGVAILCFVIGMATGLWFLQQVRNAKGERLGGGSAIKPWSLEDQALEDKIRSARLERFQSNAPKED